MKVDKDFQRRATIVTLVAASTPIGAWLAYHYFNDPGAGFMYFLSGVIASVGIAVIMFGPENP